MARRWRARAAATAFTILVLLAMIVVVRALRFARSHPSINAKSFVAVEIDETERDPIDAARLAKRIPDRRYGSWSLWKLGPLVGVELGEGRGVVLDRADGTHGGFATPPSASGVEVFFAADAGGTVALILARPSAAQLPGLSTANASAPLTRIRIMTASARALSRSNRGAHAAGAGGQSGRGGFGSEAGASAAALDAREEGDPTSLSIALDAGRSVHWTLADLERVPARERVPTERGDVPAWSLRDVTKTLLDGKSRVGAISTAQGETLNVSAAAWSDGTRVPVLRVNQRGLWKFDWVDALTKRPLRGSSLRNVTGMSATRRDGVVD